MTKKTTMTKKVIRILSKKGHLVKTMIYDNTKKGHQNFTHENFTSSHVNRARPLVESYFDRYIQHA